MPAPILTGPDALALQMWLEQAEQRLAQLENPQGPTPIFSMASTLLTVANAATNANCQVYASDLHCPAVSDGVHWYRSDSGALIV